MFGTSTYTKTFSCMAYIDERLSTREITIDIQLDMSECSLHIETVAFDRLSYLFDIVLTECILIDRVNKDLDKIDKLSYNTLVYCFGEPVDSFIALMLYQKLVAILGEHVFVEALEIKVEPDAGFKYSFTSEQLGARILPEDDLLAKRNLVPYGIDKIWYYRDDVTCNDSLYAYSAEGIVALPLGDWLSTSDAETVVPKLAKDAFVLPQDGDLTWDLMGMSWEENKEPTAYSKQTNNIKQFKPKVVK